MPDFIEKPKTFKPIRPGFWDRQFGPEFNEWEFEIMSTFHDAKKAERPSISGTVIADPRLGRGRFLLTPAQFLIQDYVLCVCPPDIRIPANGSYVNVHGRKRHLEGRAGAPHYGIVVEDLVPSKIEIPTKPEIGFRDFQDLLLMQWNGIDSLLREMYAFEFVSSPPIFPLRQAGGLSFCMYDGTGHGLARKLLGHFRHIIPSDIIRGRSGSVEVPWMSRKIRPHSFPWSFKMADADKPLSRTLTHFLMTHRSRRYSEISVGLGSRRSAPTSLYEPPLVMVDQPTLLPDTAERQRMNMDPPLEIAKYIIAIQMRQPAYAGTEEDLTRALDEAGSKLVTLANRMEVPELVTQNALCDPSFYGRPQSILRIALASARAQEKSTIDTSWITKTFDDYFLPNFQSNLERWPDLFTSKGVEIVSLKHNLDRQVSRFITDTETRETGVGFHLVQRHFANRNEIELRRSIELLLRKGRIRAIKHDVFRSVPIE